MRQLISSFFILCILTSCRQGDNQISETTVDNNTVKIIPDTMNYAVLSYDTSDIWLSTWVFQKSKPAELDLNDIKDLQSIISLCVDKYNKTEAQKELAKYKKQNPSVEISVSSFTIDLSKYKRQFIAIINDKNEKEVWVNCFSEYFGNTKLNIDGWKKSLYRAYDGGKTCFNFKINLTNKTYTAIEINGSG